MSHFSNEKLLEIFFAMEVLGMFLPYLKRYFQSHQRRFSPLVLKILGFFHFCWYRFTKDEGSQFENGRFLKAFFGLKDLSM